MKNKIFEGTCTAMVTPFKKNKEIDYKSAEKLIKNQLENNVNAILILGSTGEGFSLSPQEKQKYISFVRSILPNSCKLLVGAGSNNYEETINQINDAERNGVDGCLVQTPYFCKCSQNGIINHFREICKKTSLPIIVYNIPSRAGNNIKPQTMLELLKFDNIVGLKEANSELNHILQMTNAIDGKIAFYCGNDNLYQLFLSLGCSGTISVTSNVFPSEIAEMWNIKENSLSIHNKLFNFNNLMFCEPNPIPVKFILSKLNLIENELRNPLTRLEKKHEKEIINELKNLKIIE